MLYNCLCTTGRYLDCNGTCLWNNVPLCSGKWKAKGLGSCGKWLSTYLVTLRNMMSLRGRSVHDTCGFCSTPRWSVLLTEIVHQKIPWNSVEILCQPTGFRFVTNILHTSNWSTKYMEVDNMAVSLTILLATSHFSALLIKFGQNLDFSIILWRPGCVLQGFLLRSSLSGDQCFFLGLV